MPATLHYSHRILERMAADRHSDVAPFLEPDAKSQVTLQYENGRPVRALKLVVSTQHSAALSNDAGQKKLRDYVIGQWEQVLPQGWMPSADNIFVNPTGLFEIGGPDGDAGLTGRKIIVDTYGGASPHGGGAFSGKDPTKVDRSAAYITRYLAKNIVSAKLAEKCTIQLSYAIGVAEPLSLYVDTHGTGAAGIEDKLELVLPKLVRLTPKGIRTHLGLNKPIYQRTAAYGHFGRTPDADGGFSWEKTDLADAIKAAL
jgi:S-adenosylmethionine synthetase